MYSAGVEPMKLRYESWEGVCDDVVGVGPSLRSDIT